MRQRTDPCCGGRQDTHGCSSASLNGHPKLRARSGIPASGPFFASRLRACARRTLRRVVHVPDHVVAPASRRLETRAVQHRDDAAAVADQLALLQRLRRPGDPDASHPEHVSEELLRHAKAIGFDAVVGHQEPASEAPLNHVKTIARGGLRDLGHQGVNVAVQFSPQRRA